MTEDRPLAPASAGQIDTRTAEPDQTNPSRGRLTRRQARILAPAVGLVIALGCWAFLQLPLDVPDASSPARSNHQGTVDAGNRVGQTFVPERDNLDRISLVLATEQSDNVSGMTLTVRDGGPDGAVLRIVGELISKLPEGNPYEYRPGGLDERWHPFYFEPIPQSAGRKLFFSVEGPTLLPENKAKVLMMFYNGYPAGNAYVNGESMNAHVVFRAHSRAQVKDYLGVLAENMTLKKPGLLASPVTYAALGLAYLLLLAGLLRSVRRALRG